MQNTHARTHGSYLSVLIGSSSPLLTQSTTSTSAVQREDDIDLYKIISAYSSTESDLSLQLGDIVEVDDIEDGWAYVRLLRRDKQQICKYLEVPFFNFFTPKQPT